MSCKILSDMEPFDAAFAMLTGHAKLYDKLDLSFDINAAVAKDIAYSPEAILLTAYYKRVWTEESKEFTKALIASFDFSKNGKVKKRKLNKAKKLCQKTADAMANRIRSRTKAIFRVTTERAARHFTKQIKKKPKRVKRLVKLDAQTEAWLSFMRDVNADHVEEFITKYPDRILAPQIGALVKLLETSPEARAIDLVEIEERLLKIPVKSAEYWANLSDVYVGRQWHFTGVEMMWEAGVTEYQLISQGDKNVCPVCERLHGHIFSVQQAKDKMDKFLQLKDPDAISQHYKFPRVNKQAWRAWRRKRRQ